MLLGFNLFCALITLSLTVWQGQRYFQKQDLKHQFLNITQGAPTPAAPGFTSTSVPNTIYTFEVKTWVPDYQLRVFHRHQGRDGAWIFMPARLTDGMILFINIGWTQSVTPVPAPTMMQFPGILKAGPRIRWVTAAPPTQPGMPWYTIDPLAFAKTLNAAGPDLFVEAIPPMHPDLIPTVTPDTFDHPPHLNYAITWGLLTLVLLGYSAHVYRRIRRQTR